MNPDIPSEPETTPDIAKLLRQRLELDQQIADLQAQRKTLTASVRHLLRLEDRSGFVAVPDPVADLSIHPIGKFVPGCCQ